MPPDETKLAQELQLQLSTTFGTPRLPKNAGVLHVTALALAPEGLATLKIDEQSPNSPRDAFALQLARARADAIVITGKLLRDEPQLSYLPTGPWASALQTWRKNELGRLAGPTIWIMTRGGQLPEAHPVFSDGQPPCVVYTTNEGAKGYRRHGLEQRVGLRIEPAAEPSLSHLLRILGERGAGTVVLEAGPSVTRQAYEAELVDELMLSLFLGPVRETHHRLAPPFDDGPPAYLANSGPCQEHSAESGAWSFQRFWRRSKP